MQHTFDVISAAEHDRLEAVYEPFARAMRELVDAGVRTQVDPQTIADATAAVEAVTASLRREQRDGPHAMLHAETNRPVGRDSSMRKRASAADVIRADSAIGLTPMQARHLAAP